MKNIIVKQVVITLENMEEIYSLERLLDFLQEHEHHHRDKFLNQYAEDGIEQSIALRRELSAIIRMAR